MIITITQANYIKDYIIELTFSDGIVKKVNLKDSIFNDHRKIFIPLRDIKFFKDFTLDSWTLTWKNELDFAPEFLYDLALKQDKELNKFTFS